MRGREWARRRRQGKDEEEEDKRIGRKRTEREGKTEMEGKSGNFTGFSLPTPDGIL
jgi:hypothetical protein